MREMERWEMSREIFGGDREQGKERGKRDGYIGIKPDPSNLSALYPVPLSTEKPSMDQGKTLATLGFMDMIYYPWTDFIFPGRDLFAVDTLNYFFLTRS